MTDADAKFIHIGLFCPREPYVEPGQVASYIGRIPSSFSFTGAIPVCEVLPWNGRCYPVTLRSEGWFIPDRMYPDSDLSVLHKEVPAGFWSMKISLGFKNVHAYVRKKRQLARRRFVRWMHRVLRHDRPKSQTTGTRTREAEDMALRDSLSLPSASTGG